MVNARPEFGERILSETLNGLGDYILVTMEEPWTIVKDRVANQPAAVIFNRDMAIEHLEDLERTRKVAASWIVGFGGGTSCDTAKYLSWKWNIPLVISPSIISVDAWLCTSIAVRVDGKVRYIGNVQPSRVLVDYSIVRAAPRALNVAGVSDTISIVTALGDWIIARDEFGDPFDQGVFDQARAIARELMARASDIRAVSDAGIQALVKGYVDEVALCEAWGNARPEEGGEHFLAYCLEEITRGHYIHGNLVGLNVLVVLRLQRDKAAFTVDEVRSFFDEIGLAYAPAAQGISRADYEKALRSVQAYVKKEGHVHGLWSRETVFDETGPCSIEGILDWVYGLPRER